MAKTAAVAFEVRWRKNGDPDNQWSSPVSVGADGHVSVPGLERVTDYTFEARAVSGCGAKSTWATQTFNLPDVPEGTLILSELANEISDAQAAADAANAQLANIASDNILSPAEKPTVMRDYSVITTDQAGIDAQALNYLHAGSSQQTAYDNAISALTTYLGTLTTPVAWNNKSGNTTIVGATFRANFNAVYTARQTLLDAIYAQANALTQGGGDNLLFNPGFESNVVGSVSGSKRNLNVAVSDGWYVYQTSDGMDVYWYGPAAHTGSAGLFIRGTAGFTVPANSGFSVLSRVVSRPMWVNGGDTLTIGGWVNAATAGGLTILSRIGLYLHKTDGTTVEYIGNDVVGSTSGWSSRAPFSLTLPLDTVSVQLQCSFFIENNTAAPVTIASGSAFFAMFDDLWVTRNDLRVAGSGTQIGDVRQLPPTNTMGVSSVLSTSPVTYSISGTTITFSAAAFSVFNSGVTINYGAASCSVTQAAGTTQTYYLYFSDPTYAGGSQTMHATTSIQTMAQSPGVVNIANATVTVNAGGGGTGGGGSGGGGWCVADDMFIGDGRRAGDADIGDPFDCIDLPTQAGKHVRALQGVTRGTEECVRMITSDGCALVCSVSTPFDLPDGRSTTAPHMLGEQVITDFGTATVISLALVGPRPVTRAHLGGVSYAAGAHPARRIYSHNFGVQKP